MDPDWRPTATRSALQMRANLVQSIRAFFQQRDVLEVETPLLGIASTSDPALESFATCYDGPDLPKNTALFLQTSPEFHMKRLLAAGSGSIYQLCKAFRNGESGRRHNPEFTILEWYRLDFSLEQLIDEVAALVCQVMAQELPYEQISYAEMFQRYVGIDPHAASAEDLRRAAVQHQIPGADQCILPHRDAWLDLLLTSLIEHQLGIDQLTFVVDYPASQAALAQIKPGQPPVARRFELYLQGMELANGFQELTDSVEQRERWLHDQQQRQQNGQSVAVLDQRLLAALTAGVPACAGVALGVDRLLMLRCQAQSLDEVLAFPLIRA